MAHCCLRFHLGLKSQEAYANQLRFYLNTRLEGCFHLRPRGKSALLYVFCKATLYLSLFVVDVAGIRIQDKWQGGVGGSENGGLRQSLLEKAEGLLALWRPNEATVLLEQVVQQGSCAGEPAHKHPIELG